MSPLVQPLAALLLAAALARLGRRPGLLLPVAAGGMVVITMLGIAAAVSTPSLQLTWSPAFGLTLAVEGFGRVMVVLVPAVATPVIAYAASTGEEDQPRLLAGLAAFVSAMLLVVSAGDFITLLVGWELVGAASWVLIGHGWRDWANVESATQAFLTTRLGDLGLYVAAGATFAASGDFAFTGIGAANSPWIGLIASGVLFAAAAKSAQLPFSPWLFAAMSGPTPVSALLHSATLVAAGAYLLIRLSPALAIVPWFLPATVAIGLATALAGGVVASVHHHGKRVLAASTSAQYGLMFLAIGAGSTAAAGAQLVTHAVFKALLFLAAGIALHATGTPDIRRWRLGRALRAPAVAAAIGALALAGVPPLGAAWSKEAVLAAADAAAPVIGLLALVAAFLTAVYAVRFLVLAYGPGRADAVERRPGRVELASLGLLAAATVTLGILWLPGARALVETATGGVLAEGTAAALAAALAVLVAGASIVVLLDRRGSLVRFDAPAAVEDWLGLPTLTSRVVVRPVLALAAGLARADDRVIDAGIRAAVRVAAIAADLTSRRIDVSVDRALFAAAAGGLALGGLSRRADEAVVDGAVEGTGRAVGRAGTESRRLQTGLTHHYYVVGAIGVAVIAVILVVAR